MALQVKKQEPIGPLMSDLTLKAQQAQNNQIQNRPQPRPVPMNNRFAPPVIKRPVQPGFNPIGGVVDFGTNIAKYLIDTTFKAGNTAALLPVQLGQAATGNWNTPQAKKIRDDIQKRSFISDKIISGKATPLEFAQGFANAGIEASNLVPVKGALTGWKAGMTKEAAKKAVAGNVKQAGIYGTANTANDAAQGREVTPESVAINYAAPAALGTVSELAGAGLSSAVGKTIKNGKPAVAKPAVSKKAATADVKEGLTNFKADPVETMLYGKQMPATGRQLTAFERLNPDRLIRENITRPLVNKLDNTLFKASASGNSLVRVPVRVAQGFSKEIGSPVELKQARRRFYGSSELGKVMGQDVAAKSKGISQDSLTRIWATLEDPARVKEMGLNPKAAVLTAEEAALRQTLKKITDATTAENFKRGLITKEQASNKNYLLRAYDPFELPEAKQLSEQFYKSARTALTKQFKGRKEVKGDLLATQITDPSYLVGTKIAKSHAAWAHVDYANWLDANGYTFAQAGKGLQQLPTSKLFGSAGGKWVTKNIYDDFMGFQFTNKALQNFYELISRYDQLGIRQFKKQLLTIYNPAVRVGNQVTNRTVFATLNGLNPVRFNTMMQKTKKMIDKRDPYYLEALEEGLMRTDITRADFVKNLAQYVDDPNILKEAGNWFQKSYSGADDRAKLSAYVIRREQGYSKAEAATMAQRGFQDYGTVGFFYDMAAKTPLIGNAFVRFAGDSVRILSNAFIDNPMTTMGSLAAWGTFVELMSKMSGESDETQKTREERFGAPTIPLTSGLNKLATGNDRNISLNVQTPWGEINVGRFMPWNNLNEISGPGRILPYAPLDYTKPGNWQDPLLGQVGQLIADRDFRNKSIQDPNNVVYDQKGVVKKFTEPTQEERIGNVVRFITNNNVPLAREFDSVSSALSGKADMYNNTREPLQAGLRAAGIKIEQYDQKRAEEQRKKDLFFDGDLARTKDFLKQNPDLEEAYYKFNNPTRDRNTNIKVSNLISPERWTLIRSDASGRLFNFLKSEAEIAARDGKPVDPIFKIKNPEQQRLVLELRSRPTGEDIETEEILRATQPWYTQFEQAERDFYTKSKEFYSQFEKNPDAPKQNQRVTDYTNVKYPEQSRLVKDYYALRAQDPAAAKSFFKANANQLSADFDKYKSERLNYINAKRKIEGFAPIDAKVFDNVTFGYENDESKVARDLYFKGVTSGYGGSSRKSKKARAVFSNSVSGGRRTKLKGRGIRVRGKFRVTGGAAAKPKVSIKKSLV